MIAAMEQDTIDVAQRNALETDLEDLFFVIQLYSYPGNYVAEKPVIERIAETLDKFEEDVFHAVYPALRGDRHVVVQFGDPIVASRREGKACVAEWTDQLERRVQSLLDDINAHPPALSIACQQHPPNSPAGG